MLFFQRSCIASSADLAHLEVVENCERTRAQTKSAKTTSARVAHGIGDAFWLWDPFAEVKGLISDKMVHLEDEAAADAEEKFLQQGATRSEAEKADKTAVFKKAIYEL